MTPDLSHLSALAAAATPGPWRNGSDPSHFDAPEVTDDKTFSYYVPKDANAAFIAAANPAAILSLVDRVRQLEECLLSTAAVLELAEWGRASQLRLAKSIRKLVENP
jgi:hypothetical protein